MPVELKAPEAVFCLAGEVQKTVNIYSSKTEYCDLLSWGERKAGRGGSAMGEFGLRHA